MKWKLLVFIPAILFFMGSFYFLEKSFYAPLCQNIPEGIRYVPHDWAEAFEETGWHLAFMSIVFFIGGFFIYQEIKD